MLSTVLLPWKRRIHENGKVPVLQQIVQRFEKLREGREEKGEKDPKGKSWIYPRSRIQRLTSQ